MKTNQKAKGTTQKNAILTMWLMLLGVMGTSERTEAAVAFSGNDTAAAGFNIGMLFPLLIGFVLLSALVTDVAFNAEQAQGNASVPQSAKALLGILALLFIAIPLLIMFKSSKLGG